MINKTVGKNRYQFKLTHILKPFFCAFMFKTKFPKKILIQHRVACQKNSRPSDPEKDK